MRFFAKTILFTLIIFTSLNLSYSYEFRYVKDVQVGNEPVGVYYDNQKEQFHIICKGTDRNFNGKFEPDSGDVVPSWWVLKIDKLGEIVEVKKVKEFPFGSIPFPFRPTFVPNERKIWINHYDGISAYNLDNYESVGNKIEIFGVTSLDYKSGHLLIAQSSFAGKIDTAFVYSINQKKIMNKYPTGINLVQARMYQPQNPDFKGVAAISVGNFGSDSSIFHKSEFLHFQEPIFENTIIGNTANYLEIADDRFVAIPVMMSNKLVFTDLQNQSFFTEIELGEPSWDGPSFTKFLNISKTPNKQKFLVLTTTYAGKLQIHDFTYENDQGYSYLISFVTDLDLNSKGEALAFSDTDNEGNAKIVVANSVKSDYSPNNTVSVILIKDLLSTISTNQIDNNLFRINNNTLEYLGEQSQNYEISIYNLYGNKILSSHSQTITNLKNLPNGVYFAIVVQGNKIHNFKFTYIK